MKLKNILNEAGNFNDVSKKFKNALDVLPEKYFNRKGVLSLIKKLKEKNPEAAMAYTMDAFGWMSGMKEGKITEGAYKKNDKGSMLTSIIKAKSAQNYGLDNLIVLHKDIKKVFTSKENKEELLSDLNNVIEYMKKAEKFKDMGNKNTLAMVEKYWKQLSGQTVARTQKTITEAAPKMRKNKEAENLQKLMNLVANAQKGGMGSRYGKEFDKAKIKALRAMKDMVTYSNIGV